MARRNLLAGGMRGSLVILVLVTLGSPGRSDEARPANGDQAARQLVIRPASAPVPALRYALLPGSRAQVADNAALHYYRAALMKETDLPKDYGVEMDRWFTMPVKELPRGKVRALLDKFEDKLREIKLGARCDHCDWGNKQRILAEGSTFSATEGQLQNAPREFARLLRLQARLELAEGHLDTALRTLQSGFSLARHVSASPTIINAIIGGGIANVMVLELEEIVQSPGAPNLYWALTELPRPLIELRQALHSQRLWAGLVPDLRDPNLGPLTRPELESVAQQIDLQLSGGFKPAQGTTKGWLTSFTRKDVPPRARQVLLAAGRTVQQLDATPPLQIYLLYEMHQHDRYFDEIIKWNALPYWQARPRWQLVREQIKAEMPASGSMSLVWVGLLVPSLEKVAFSAVRLERRLAALRCVEAIRLFAASHGGKPPETLAAITEVPVPIDPVTGKDFQYQMRENKLLLSAPPPPGEKPVPNDNTLRYELTLIR
jgi:hypothetical protein